MKQFFRKFSIFVLILLAAYVLFSSIEKIDNGKIGAVEDLRKKKIVRIVRPGPGGYAFVWRASFPWWFSFFETPVERVMLYEMKIALPNLENLKEDYYHIVIPLRVNYRIDMQKFSDIGKLDGRSRQLDDLVERLVKNSLEKEMRAYLYPVYQREALAARMNAVLDKITGDLGEEFRVYGLVLVSAVVSGAVSLPDKALYNEGVLYATDLRQKERAVAMGLMDARSRVERQKIENEQFYTKLLEVSKIISNNPEVLKYIYIDKMGGQVKVILSSDTTGLPAMFDKETKPNKGKPGEINNLK